MCVCCENDVDVSLGDSWSRDFLYIMTLISAFGIKPKEFVSCYIHLGSYYSELAGGEPDKHKPLWKERLLESHL